MAFCGACGGFVARHQTECPDCGAPTRKADRKSMGFDSATERQRWIDDKVRTADYECRKFRLEPRRPDENDKQYCDRIDRDKTCVMFRPPERIPGSDDDKE